MRLNKLYKKSDKFRQFWGVLIFRDRLLVGQKIKIGNSEVKTIKSILPMAEVAIIDLIEKIIKEKMDKKTQKAIRNKLVRKIWKEEKASITMKDLAEILNIPLATFYRIVAGQKNEKEKQREKSA